MTTWERATPDVIEMAESLINQFHPALQRARIGLMFRDVAPVSGGKRTLGKAQKVPDQWQPFLREPLDFIIWLAHDQWIGMSPQQRRALLDHELCHLHLDEMDRAVIIPHDIEEFVCIVERHGAWLEDLRRMQRVMQDQPPLPLTPSERNGKVTAVEIFQGITDSMREGGVEFEYSPALSGE